MVSIWKKLSLVFWVFVALSPHLLRAENCPETIYENLARSTIVENDFPTQRGLQEYRNFLGPKFSEFLQQLGSKDLWVDFGSGDGVATAEFLQTLKPSQKPQVKGITYTMSPSASTKELHRKERKNLSFIVGRYVEDIPAEEIGRPKLITDLYGPLSYTHQFGTVLKKYLDLLPADGKIFIFLPGSRHMNAFVKRGVLMNTFEFLKTIEGIRVFDGAADYQLGNVLIISKTQDKVKIPELVVRRFVNSGLPTRLYEVVE